MWKQWLFNSSIQIKKKKERKTNIVAYFIREVSGAKPTIETLTGKLLRRLLFFKSGKWKEPTIETWTKKVPTSKRERERE